MHAALGDAASDSALSTIRELDASDLHVPRPTMAPTMAPDPSRGRADAAEHVETDAGCSGNVWHARCDSVSTCKPVSLPPGCGSGATRRADLASGARRRSARRRAARAFPVPVKTRRQTTSRDDPLDADLIHQSSVTLGRLESGSTRARGMARDGDARRGVEDRVGDAAERRLATVSPRRMRQVGRFGSGRRSPAHLDRIWRIGVASSSDTTPSPRWSPSRCRTAIPHEAGG